MLDQIRSGKARLYQDTWGQVRLLHIMSS